MSAGKRVLVVDDDVDFNDAVTLTLEAAGYQVLAAHSADEAMKLLRSERVDIAILDMMMEEPDAGAMVAHTLRRRPEMADIPVLLVTGVTGKTGYRPGTEGAAPRGWLGVDAWLDKPVNPSELLRKIEALTHE
ncbi:MAG: PleD family two-component system response regulator [Armatimonadota bacterium]